MSMRSILNIGFIICLSAAILFLIISVVLFFLFDIKTIYMIRSGRAQAKSVKEMQEANASTGRLRGVNKKKSKVYYSNEPVSDQAQAPQPEQRTSYAEESERTEQLHNTSQGSEETMILRQDQYDSYGEEETSLLGTTKEIIHEAPVAAETEVLSRNNNETELLNRLPAPAPSREIYFEVVKKIICRDTDEIIR